MNQPQQELTGLFRNQKNSLAIRVWHWLTALGFMASITTVMLGSTLFKVKENIPVVMESVTERGGQITHDQARNVAHVYSDKIWDTHKIIGFVLCFLMVSRMIIEGFQKKDEKMSARIRSSVQLYPKSENEKAERDIYVLVKRGYLVFYFLFILMALTGLVMAFDELPFLKPFKKTANSFHVFLQYGIYLYITLHICGVVYADLHKNKGIVSGMINGGL
jgi:Ni/Fe-hydrogenase 1 B-type cytochrome subunit